MPNIRSMFAKLIGGIKTPRNTTRYQLVNSSSASYLPWNGSVYENDIARSAIWTIAEAASKVGFVHQRGEGEDMKINPDPAMRLLLSTPNEYITMQDFIQKMVIQLEKHNNAFALISRGFNGRPVAIYPLNYSQVELREDAQGVLYCQFAFRSAKSIIVPYTDILHLRKHFEENEFYGTNNFKALYNVMDVINTTDLGVVTAVKNSAVISWLMKFSQVLKPEDQKDRVKEFSESYLNTENNGWGIMPTDPRFDVQEVKHDSFVPNAAQMDRATKRLLMYYGVSENIIMGKFNEDEWNAFYESRVEPILMQFAAQMTIKFYSPKERAFGNKICPESISMQYASMSSKLALVSMVDRGALLPNEWRRVMNLAPIPGGDKPIRRLDTQVVNKDAPADSANDPNIQQEGETVKDNEQRNKKPEIAKHDRIFEVRSAEESEGKFVEGRAIVYDQPTVMYEFDGIQYKEVIQRGALDGADMADVPMRYNHSDSFMIVARHNSARPNRSNLELIVDDSGLLIRADLSKTESARQLHEAIDVGLVDKMSFAFTVTEEEYNKDTHTRTIKKIKKLWDVSAVDTPAYDTTSIYARDRFRAEAEGEKREAEALRVRKIKLVQSINLTETLYGGTKP